MNKQLTFLLSLTFLFLFSGSVYGETEVQKNVKRLKVTNSCVGCTLVGADLSGENLTEADLSWTNLKGANLSGAYLGGAYLIGADLTEAYLIGADLTEADLTGAKMKDINLIHAIQCKTIMPWGEENSGC